MEASTEASSENNNPIDRILGRYDKAIFWPVLVTFLSLITCALVYPDATGKTLTGIRNFLLFNFSWAFLLGVALVLFFCFYLALSDYGDLKLGKEDDVPDFSFTTWIAMLFSCGLGIGFVFYGVTEPLNHLYESSRVIDMGLAGKEAGVPKAIEISILGWGIHGWSLFALSAWAIAFPAYRQGKPMTVATGLYGILGDRCNTSIWGRLADGLGTLGTIGGNAAMIGLGVASISYGLETLFGLNLSNLGKAGVMMGLIIAYVISAATGVEKGIRYLSQANMILAACVLLLLLFFGHAPTQYLLNIFTQTLGGYFNHLVDHSFWADARSFEARPWLGWWIVFYWLWWISYIPFCGGFIARISKGRTLKEFIVGVLFVPTVMAILWFSIWGGSAAYAELNGIFPLWDTVKANGEAGVYALLGSMKGGWWISLIVLINITIFAVTTSDSASFFIAMQMSKGRLNPSAPMRVLWGVTLGGIGLCLLASGKLNAIKTMAIVMGAPFFFVVIAYMFSIVKMFKMAEKGEL
ncbi:MAG: BCCT family transporter [Desulfobacterales bacterium]|nr:BCCT family transporter [Desulfobacterales bacterium]